MLADASVVRNFAVLGWVDQLVALAGGTLSVAHGVLGLGPDEAGEIERIKAAVEDESTRDPGSPAASLATAAVVGLEDLVRRRARDVVVEPTRAEIAVAVRLQEPQDREWRMSLGVHARRLDAGEAVSIAIATARGLALASDDHDACVAYLALGGIEHLWTLDLVQRAAVRGLLSEAEARRGYRSLRERYRFWGAPWP